MKKILSNVYLLAALFMIGAAITSCSKSDDTPAPEPKPVGPTTYTMNIKATKAADAKTRALTLDGNTLTASWSTSENVYVQKGSDWATGSLKPQADGGTAVLKGSLSGITIAENDNLFLQFPKSGDITYEGQLGTLNDIAANFDWATATVEVKSVSPSGDITPKAATTTFTNKQAIIKFTLVDKANDAAISPSALTVTDGTSTVSLTDIPAATYSDPNNGDGVLFVAFPAAGSAKTITLTATVGTDTYIYETTSDKTLTNGKYYAITVKMVKKYNPYTAPLTFEAANGDVEVSFYQVYNNSKPLYYSTDSINWTSHDRRTAFYVSLSKGNKVYIKGDDITNGDSEGPTRISCSGACYVYGNMMSLIYYDFIAKNEITRTNVFLNLFQKIDSYQIPTENPYIYNHPSKELALPATSLADGCYYSMFSGCSNLKRAPELPASSVPDYAYQAMFNGCSSLNYVKCLATSFGTYSTFEWLKDVAATGTFVKASGASWTTDDSGSGIPSGWTVTTE